MAWGVARFQSVVLKICHRQAGDDGFIDILNGFREGEFSNEAIKTLKSRVAVFPSKNIPRLFTHNTMVNKWNTSRLEALDDDVKTFTAQTSGPEHEV